MAFIQSNICYPTVYKLRSKSSKTEFNNDVINEEPKRSSRTIKKPLRFNDIEDIEKVLNIVSPPKCFPKSKSPLKCASPVKRHEVVKRLNFTPKKNTHSETLPLTPEKKMLVVDDAKKPENGTTNSVLPITPKKLTVSEVEQLLSPSKEPKRIGNTGTVDKHSQPAIISPKRMLRFSKKTTTISSQSELFVSNDDENYNKIADTDDKIINTPKRTPKRQSPVKTAATSPAKRTRKQLQFDDIVDENVAKSDAIPKCYTPISLIQQDTSDYQQARKALHTSTPSRILGRTNETTKLDNFINSHLNQAKPACLYVSGAPGTGKTACILQLLDAQKILKTKFTKIFINCMTVRQCKTIYDQIAQELGCQKNLAQKETIKAIEKKLSSKGNMVVIILDEMDHLNSKSQEVLYTLFEWPRLPSSRLILIGIANALDLTDRLLPRLHACGYKPKLLNFKPYSQKQILEILQDRLKEALGQEKAIFKPEALQFCARKIASSTGDVRKALDTCRRALEIAEKDVRTQQILKFTSDDGFNIKSPRKSPRKAVNGIPIIIGLPQINAVLHEIYNSKVISAGESNKSSEFDSTMPIQQKLLLCSLLLLTKHGKNKDFTIGKLHEIHSRVCLKRQIGKVDASEFLSLCDLVESRGLLNIKRNKEARLSKVLLKTDQEELQFVMKDKNILFAVLNDISVLKA